MQPGIVQPQHSRSTWWFSLILAFCLTVLPLLLVNVGFRVLQASSNDRNHRLQIETAHQTLEALAAGWEFPVQFSRHAGRLKSVLGDLSGVGVQRGGWEEIVRRAFPPPFPRPQVWLFRREAGKRRTPDVPWRTIHAPTERTSGRHAFARVFQHFLDRDRNRNIPSGESRQAQKWTRQLFGPHLPVAEIGLFLRGVPIRVIHQHRTHFLIWDAFDAPDQDDIGYFLLVPDTVSTIAAGFRLAGWADHPDTKGYTGFLAFHPGPVGDVLPAPLERSPRFQEWVRRFRRPASIRRIERSSPPWGDPLGTHALFTKILPNSTHLALAVLPNPRQAGIPSLLSLVNLLAVLGWLLVFLRGFLFGTWPGVNLRERFFGLYLLASALPFSLAIMAILAYNQERGAVAMDLLQQRLSSELKRVDQGADRIESRYLAAFFQVMDRPELKEILRTEGLSSLRPLQMVLQEFAQASPSLPLATCFLADFRGGTISTCPAHLQAKEEGLTTFYRTAMIATLRKKLQAASPTMPLGKDPLRPEETALIDGYGQIVGAQLVSHMEQRRGIPETAKVGRQSTTKIHGFLTIGGLDRFALLVAWHVADLRLPILKEAAQDFLLRLPEGRFMGYQFTPAPPSPLWQEDRHHQMLFPLLARDAGQQNRLLMKKTRLGNEEWLLAAAPSEAFDGTILSVGVPTSLVLGPLADKKSLLFRLLALSGLLVVLLGWITAERIVHPVRKVQRGLAAIAAGDFTTRTALSRRDELGSLTRAFDEMTLGLVERQRLATLVSPQTLDLMAREETLTGHQSFTQAVILVSDIRDFTTLCEQLPVEDITALLNHHFEEMYQVISSQQGKVDRFIGDAIQAVFEDLGPDLPTSGSRALRAGLLMLERLAAINAQRIETGRCSYRIGIGIAQGPILFATLGDPAIRFDRTVLGEPVKTATRLETLSKGVPACPIVVHPQVNLTGDPLAADLHPLASHEGEGLIFPQPGTERTNRR